MDRKKIEKDCISLLKKMIATQSFSKEESDVAAVIRNFLSQQNITFETIQNNTYCYNKYYDTDKPTVLLNSHIDTVKPAKTYTKNPLEAITEDGKLYGLGSNDAGASLVSLLATFLFFYDADNLQYNLLFVASAEEEISGANGIVLLEEITQNCSFGIIGEPTEMKMAIAEKGLMVLDAEVKGKSGHAARNEGVNAIYLAMQDIQWFKEFQFKKISPILGPIKMTVSVINAGTQHNVVPDTCKYIVDVRTIPEYTNEHILEIIQDHIKATITARSFRLQPSSIDNEHILVKTANKLSIETFGSSTLSDQALLKIPTIKMGPGKSERSHTADEFIFITEIENGIDIYIKLLENII